MNYDPYYNFLTGAKKPPMGMMVGMPNTDFATQNSISSNAMPGTSQIPTPTPAPASSGFNKDKFAAGLSALGSALGGEQQPITPAEFAPVPMPQQAALPNLTPQLAQFDFADYLRKRQAGLL